MPVYRIHIVSFILCTSAAFAASAVRVNAQGCSSCQARSAPAYYQPTVAYQAPTTPSIYGGAGCNACNQTVAQPLQAQPLYQQPAYRPIPRTSYRTEWLPTRVTNYAPTTVLNPATGVPVTSYRACQTQRYQIQRVPTLGLFSSGSSCASGCGSRQYMSSAVPGCSSCGSTPTYAPTTSIPFSTTPTTVSPSPAATLPGTATTPGATTTPGPATSPGGAAPAETRPSLKPEARTNARGASVREFDPQPSYNLRDSSPNEPTVPSLDAPSRSIRITPVPDPDVRYDSEQPAGDAPPLLDPRQKTAVRPTNLRTAYTPVAWPRTSAAPLRKPASRDARPASAGNSGEWKTVDW